MGSLCIRKLVGGVNGDGGRGLLWKAQDPEAPLAGGFEGKANVCFGAKECSGELW